VKHKQKQKRFEGQPTNPNDHFCTLNEGRRNLRGHIYRADSLLLNVLPVLVLGTDWVAFEVLSDAWETAI